MRVLTAAACVLALVAGGLLSVAPVASAAPAASEEHCFVDIESGAAACSQDAAVARATVSRGAVAARVDRVTFWDKTSYKGESITFQGSSKCTPSYGDINGQVSNLGDWGWNNRATSLKTYNRCDVKLYNGVNFTGASSVWIDRTPNLAQIGAGWNNRASSYKST